jgi:hypothetical protein
MNLLNKSFFAAFALLAAAGAFAQDDTSRFESSEEEAAEQSSDDQEKSDEGDDDMDMSDKGESDEEDDE